MFVFFSNPTVKGREGKKKKSTDVLSLTSLTDKVVYEKTLIPTLAYSRHVNSSKSLQLSLSPDSFLKYRNYYGNLVCNNKALK